MASTLSSRETILIADDHAPFRELVKSALRPAFANFAECANGRDVVERYRAIQPSWVFMDVAMPEVDGVRATRQLMAAFPEARVVVITNHPSEDIRLAAEAAGACAVFSKEDLLDAVEYISVRRAGGTTDSIQP